MGVTRLNILLFMILISGCTTSRWVVDPAPSLDLLNSTELETEPRITLTKTPSFSEPVIELTVLNKRLLEVPMVFKSRRVIQRYRPKYIFIAAGLGMAAGTVVLADYVDGSSSNPHKNILRATAGVMAIGSFFHVKPVGDPIDTGETRLVGTASVSQLIDSTAVYPDRIRVIMNAAMDGQSLVSGREFIFSRNYTINLIDELNLTDKLYVNDDVIEIQLVTEFEILDLKVPISSFMSRYIRIMTPNTPVRSNPEVTETNIITNVAPNSYLPMVNSESDAWYKTTLGASTAYIQKSDGNLVWRVGAGYNSDFIVSTAGSLRGSVDIERDIPVSSPKNPNAIGIIVTQESYPPTVRYVNHAHRSGDLFHEYLTQVLGVYEQNIIRLKSSNFPESLIDILKNIEAGGSYDFDNKNLYWYFAGAGGITIDSLNVNFSLLASDIGNSIDLESILQRIAALNTSSNVLLFETDFSNGQYVTQPSLTTASLNSLMDRFISGNPNSALFFACEVNQIASNYQSNDLRTDRVHGIFTYYFLQSLHSGNFSLPQLRDNLLRNVTFTSRRLHNRAQDPMIRFNSNFTLRPVE